VRHLPLLTLLGCIAEEPVPTTEGERTLTLVYSNNLDGEIEPCG
jgi:hypothetical protein